MDWGNLILFWFIGMFILLILNVLLFRFALVRKLVYLVASIILIACGFNLGALLKKDSFLIGGSTLSWDNSNIDTMIVFSVIMLILVLLMSIGDSLLDFEEDIGFNVNVSEFLGSYFFSVSEERITVPSFFTYYAVATVIALVIHYVCVIWLKWFNIFGILGCVALAYMIVIKPILIKLSDS